MILFTMLTLVSITVELGLLAGDGSPDTALPGASISLLHLVKQLLRSGTAQSLSALQNLTPCPKEQPSLNLLLRFQRLLIAQIYPHSQVIAHSGNKFTIKILFLPLIRIRVSNTCLFQIKTHLVQNHSLKNTFTSCVAMHLKFFLWLVT